MEEMSIDRTDEERTEKSSSEPSSKRRKVEEAIYDDDDALDYEPDSDDMGIDEDEDVVEIDDPKLDTETDIQATEWFKRLMLLEGGSDIAIKQNTWGISKINSQWHIIEKHLQKFIEVKVITDYNRAIETYNDKSAGMDGHTLLFCVHPYTCQIQWVDHPGKLIKESKVVNFLARRRPSCVKCYSCYCRIYASIISLFITYLGHRGLLLF